MDRDELLNLGVEENVADMIVEENLKMREEYESKIEAVRRDGEVELLLRDSGARNIDVLRALIDANEDPAEQIERLRSDDKTRFLFEKKRSFEPKRSSDRLPDTKKTDFEEKLIQARRCGNTVEAIRIKQMAASEGIMLL